jgi:hypothetical protein
VVVQVGEPEIIIVPIPVTKVIPILHRRVIYEEATTTVHVTPVSACIVPPSNIFPPVSIPTSDIPTSDIASSYPIPITSGTTSSIAASVSSNTSPPQSSASEDDTRDGTDADDREYDYDYENPNLSY